MAPQPFWILIANSSKARLFEEKSPEQTWRDRYTVKPCWPLVLNFMIVNASGLRANWHCGYKTN